MGDGLDLLRQLKAKSKTTAPPAAKKSSAAVENYLRARDGAQGHAGGSNPDTTRAAVTAYLEARRRP